MITGVVGERLKGGRKEQMQGVMRVWHMKRVRFLQREMGLGRLRRRGCWGWGRGRGRL